MAKLALALVGATLAIGMVAGPASSQVLTCIDRPDAACTASAPRGVGPPNVPLRGSYQGARPGYNDDRNASIMVAPVGVGPANVRATTMNCNQWKNQDAPQLAFAPGGRGPRCSS